MSAPEMYVMVDNEDNRLLYQGVDTLVNLPEGLDKNRWMEKAAANLIKIHPIAGLVLINALSGEQTLKLFDDWKFDNET